MRVRPLSVTVTLLAAVVLSGLFPGGGATDHETFTLAGVEIPAGCSPPTTLICYEVVRGDPQTDIREGETIKVTLTAAGEAPHNVNVIEESNSDSLHLDTDASQAIASSSTASAGLSTSFEFVAPAEGTVLYFWCDIVEHEIAGMWFTATVGAPLGAPANNTTSGPTTQNETAGNATSGNSTASGNGTANADVEDDAAGNTTADGNATVQDSDGETGVDEDAPAVSGLLALLGAAMVASRARRRG